MDLKHIRYFITIAEERSFSKAAQKLYISQPALSICIQRLEKELNAKLFTRTKNTVSLTMIGNLFFEEGVRLLQMSQGMLERINDTINFERGFIKVGISQFYGRYFAPQLFYEFKQNFPSIRFEIIEDFSTHLETLVANGSLDMCFIPTPILSDNIQSVTLFQEQIFFATSKNQRMIEMIPSDPSGNFPTIDISSAKYLPFVMLKKHQKTRKIGEQICSEAGFIPDITVEAQDFDTVNNFIALGMGVGFIPDTIVRKSDSKNFANYYQIKSDKATRAFVIAFKKGIVLSNACENFIQLAVDKFKNRTYMFA